MTDQAQGELPQHLEIAIDNLENVARQMSDRLATYREYIESRAALRTAIAAELETRAKQAEEAVQVLNAGRPLGDVVGLHALLNATAEVQRLTAALAARDEQIRKTALQALTAHGEAQELLETLAAKDAEIARLTQERDELIHDNAELLKAASAEATEVERLRKPYSGDILAGVNAYRDCRAGATLFAKITKAYEAVHQSITSSAAAQAPAADPQEPRDNSWEADIDESY